MHKPAKVNAAHILGRFPLQTEKETRLITPFPYVAGVNLTQSEPRKHSLNPRDPSGTTQRENRPKKGTLPRRGWLSRGPKPKLLRVCFDPASGSASRASKLCVADLGALGHLGPRHCHVLRAAVPQLCIWGRFARACTLTGRVLLCARIRDLLRLSEPHNSVRSRRAPTFDLFFVFQPEGVRACRARQT